MKRTCGTCKHIGKPTYDYPCCVCITIIGQPPNSRWEAEETPTNADHIRGMTDEELADLLEGERGNMLPGTALKWLQQPWEEGDHGL